MLTKFIQLLAKQCFIVIIRVLNYKSNSCDRSN